MFPARHWVLALSLPLAMVLPTVADATEPHCSAEPSDGAVIIIPGDGHHEETPSQPGHHEETPSQPGHHEETPTKPGEHEEGDIVIIGGHRTTDPVIVLDPISGHGGGFATSLKNGKSYILLSKYSGKCLDVKDHATSPGGELQQWECHGRINQQFRALEVKKGEFLLVGEESKLCAKVKGASTCDGAPVQLSDGCKGKAARLNVKASSPGSFALSFVHSGKCLDVRGPSSDDGALVQQWACHGGENQNWFLFQLN